MFAKRLCLLALAGIAASCSTTKDACCPAETKTHVKTLQDFQQAGKPFKNLLRLPLFETTPEAVTKTTEQTMTNANAALDRIGKLKANEVSFTNTVGALDANGVLIAEAMNRIYLIKETSTNTALREAATEAVKRLQEWAVGLDYREDVYRAVKAYADTNPQLNGEEA